MIFFVDRSDGDACPSHVCCRSPQGRQVAVEPVPQWGVLRPCFLPENIVEWAALEQVLSGHRGCVTGAPVRLTNLEFVEHVGVHPVVSSPESEQDDLVCSVQLVVAVRRVEIEVLLAPLSRCESLDDGLLIFV